MHRYAALGLIGLFASHAWAQQAPPQAEAPAPSSTPAQAQAQVQVQAQPAKSVVAMEDPLPGDRWTYEVRDEITGKVSATRANVVTEVTPKEVSVRFKIVGTPNEGFNVYDRSWNLVDAQPWKYQPNDGSGIQMPLAVGKTWTIQSNDVNSANGAVWKRSGTSKVVGQETVTTKAGTFETFKIETSLSRRNVNDPTRKSEIEAQTWYAPAIDHWVKRTFMARVDKHVRANNTIELTEYGRKQ
jgi:hypothetical protein